MRISVVNTTRRKIGGAESYLNVVLPFLVDRGHEVSLLAETDTPKERMPIAMPDDAANWVVADLGKDRALSCLREWEPDVIYKNNLSDPDLEAQIQEIAPAVSSVHDYYGTCASLTKTYKSPVVMPCSRCFGPSCLVYYYPRRCGGLNPVTMLKLYRLQSKRLALLRRCDAVITHSEHMMHELLNHGLNGQVIYNIPYYVNLGDWGNRKSGEAGAVGPPSTRDAVNSGVLQSKWQGKPGYRLLFSGRMEFLKGGQVFLDALPQAAQALGKPVLAVLAGDGRERHRLERRAAQLQSEHSEVLIEFAGWLGHEQLAALLTHSDLLVMPSLWPEPFGMAGPEAGIRGVPAAAFDVGGISDWLIDGVNGALAPGNPPTSAGLAEAIVRCLRDPAAHARLRQGAIEQAGRFNIKEHLTSLVQIFESVAMKA